jgi:serine protease Do
MLSLQKTFFTGGRIFLTGVLVLGFYSTDSRAAYTVPVGGPTTEVHPEVLKLQESFAQVAELDMPSVVSISTIHMESAPDQQFYFGDPMEQFFGQFFNGQEPNNASPYGQQMPRRSRPYKLEGMGSGVIIDPDGLVLTNEHVVHDADQIKVTLYDHAGKKTDYTARVVGKDARTDLAVVRIHAEHKLPFAALGDSDKSKTGDWAIAIGSPFGLAQTFTVGVISAARQSLTIEDKEYHNLIQTDAAINRGNSGGPLLNIRGEVVGINTAIYAPTGVFSGIGFAIPVNQAKAILQELINKGRVVRGWLGVELAREITPAMVRAFSLPDTQGALINEVMKNAPAEKSGLKRGDVIRSFGSQAIESSDQLQTLVAQTPPNQSVPLKIIRDHKEMTLALVLGERPESVDNDAEAAPSDEEAVPSDKKMDQKEWLGAHLVKLTENQMDQLNLPENTEGVLVADVDGGSHAEDVGLAPGDLIRSVNQIPTPDLATFSKATANLDLSQGVVLDILRQGHPMYLSYTKGQ